MKPIPLVRKAALAPAVSYLAREGVPVNRHLRRAALSAPGSEELESLVPLHQVCDFLSSVARSEGIADLGFRVGGEHGTELLGLYGRFLMQAVTIHGSIRLSEQLIPSYNSGLRIWLEHHGDQVRYCQKYVADVPGARITEVVHLALENSMAMGRYLIGDRWRPNRVELASDPIDLSAYFPELVDVPVRFRQPFNSIWMDTSVMGTPIRRASAHDDCASEVDAREAYRQLGPASDPICQLEQAIESALGHPRIGLRLTASIIGTSARTLQRRLTDRGTSFSRLLQDIRFRNAQLLLRDPKMPLKEIGKRLGYTDLSNFIRAFKRWTGVGPSEYRRMHQADCTFGNQP